MAVRNIATDPLRNFKFRVNIMHNSPGYPSLSTLGFMSASGLAVTTEPISYREGGDNTTPRKMPGQSDFPPLSLTRGMVGTVGGSGSINDPRMAMTLLWQWYREIFFVTQGGGLLPVNGNGPSNFRSNIFIHLMHHPVTRHPATPPGQSVKPVAVAWKLFNAWPASLAFSDLDAGGNGVMVNNMTLMYEGFDMRTNGDTSW